MKYTEKRFNFKGTTGPVVQILSFNCESEAHNSCPRTLGMDWASCDCRCHELAVTP